MTRLILIATFTLTFSLIYGQKSETIYLDKNDSSKNCYTIIYPPKLPWTGYLFLIPGFGETADRVLQQTDIPVVAARSGLLVVIPTFKDGVLSFGIDDSSQDSFIEIWEDVTSKHKLLDQSFFVGGFSIGGSAAIKYAETAIKMDYKIKPTAVFAIDPPLDFERFYNSSKRDVRLSVNTQASQENVYMINRIEQVMGGSPTDAIENYYQISPYSFSDINQSAIKPITNLPIRLYSEPDVHWWIKERGSDFSAMNVLDCSAMINELNRLGNNKAELITTQNKGLRQPNNQRHPHSWSIVDSENLIKWLLEQK